MYQFERGSGGFGSAPYNTGYGRSSDGSTQSYGWGRAGWYNAGGRNSNYGRFPSQGVKSFRKRTGASTGRYSPKSGPNKGKDLPYVRGWRVQDRNIVTYLCTPYHKTKRRKTKVGREFETWLCKIQYKNGTEERRPCIYWLDRGHVVVGDLSLVISPKSNYCGANFKRKQR